MFVGDVNNAILEGVQRADKADIILYSKSSKERFGWSVSTAGDINGDGFHDVIIGAQGENNTYIYFGTSNKGTINTSESSFLKYSDGNCII